MRSGLLVEEGNVYFTASLLPWEASYFCAVDANTGKVTDATQHFINKLDGVTLEGPLAATPDKLVVPQGRVAPELFDKKPVALGSLAWWRVICGCHARICISWSG